MYLFQYILLVSASLAVALPNMERRDADCVVNARAADDWEVPGLWRYKTQVLAEGVDAKDYCGHYKPVAEEKSASNIQCTTSGDGKEETIEASFPDSDQGIEDAKYTRDTALKRWMDDAGCSTG